MQNNKVKQNINHIRKHYLVMDLKEMTTRGGENFIALTEMLLQKGKCGFVAEIYGELWVDLPLQLHQLTDPVARQEGEVWETLVDCSSDEDMQTNVNIVTERERKQHNVTQSTRLNRLHFHPVSAMSVIPDGDHFSMYDG